VDISRDESVCAELWWAPALPTREQISQHADLRSVVADLVEHRRERQVAALPGMALVPLQHFIGAGSQRVSERRPAVFEPGHGGRRDG